MIFDTHAHLNTESFNEDIEEVVNRCKKEKISVINVGVDYKSSKKALEIAQKYNFYASVGIHPLSSTEKELSKIKKIALHPRNIAIGETGLDFYHQEDKSQEKLFLEQLKIAKELQLPVIIHCRKAHNELLKILQGKEIKGVIHCFTGNWKQAEKYLEMGFYLGINGIIFKLDLYDIIKKTPLEKILLETDCPYLGFSNKERNEPIFVKELAKKISEIKEIDLDEVIKITNQNAKKLFKI